MVELTKLRLSLSKIVDTLHDESMVLKLVYGDMQPCDDDHETLLQRCIRG